MGKHKQRFNKKQAVRFTLVPGFDQNGKPITHFRPVQTKKSKVNPKQRQNLIKQLSDQVYDQIQINGRLVGQDQIPAFVLQQIRGRKDLVFNQKMMQQQQQNKQEQGDLYEVVDAADYDDQYYDDEQDKQWIDQEDIIDEDEGQYTDQEGEWSEVSQGQEQETQIIDDDDKNKGKSFVLKQEDFPVLKKINVQGQQYQLTEQQIKLLDVLIPQNYQKFQIKGIKFQKYDQNGLPLSQKAQYEEFLATGKQGVIDSFDYVPETPTPIYDTDLKPSQLTGQLKQIEDALNFQGQQDAYEELQDDFFAKLIKSQIQNNKKQKKAKKQANKKVKVVNSKPLKPELQQLSKVKLPKILQKQQNLNQKQQNIFAKYDQLDEDILQEQITDDMLDKALDDFQKNLEPQQNKKQMRSHLDQEQQIQERASRTNASMNFSQIQKCQQLFGKDGQLDWRCLTKKQKRQYMKTKIIRDYYDQMRQRQISQKIKGKKNITAQQLHLKSTVKHLTFQEDHVMRKALQEDAKQQVDLEQDSSYQQSSEEQNIVQYRQRTSVISTNLNEISQPSKKKKKKKVDDSQQRLKQLDQLSATLSKLKASSQKRDRNQTKEQRKLRKQKQKQLKKQKKEVKKQFAQKFNEERRKHLKMSKPADPLHKISYVKII